MTQSLCKVLRKQLIKTFSSTILDQYLYPVIASFQGVIYDFCRIKILTKDFFQFLVKLHALKRIIWSSKFGVWICVTGMNFILLLLTIMFFIDFLHKPLLSESPHLWPLPPPLLLKIKRPPAKVLNNWKSW